MAKIIKNATQQTSGLELINAIINDVSEIESTEEKAILETALQMAQRYSEEDLLKNFKKLHKLTQSETDKTLILATWKNKELTLAQKAHFLAKHAAALTPIPSKHFIDTMWKFLGIMKNDKELNSFLANPQGYINSQQNLSAYALQILQTIINDPLFNNLSAVNRPVAKAVSTPLASQMHQLNLPQYASTDAARFPQCINPDVADEVLAKAKKEYHGPKVMGFAGAMASYHREAIKQTALNVKKMKMGACHTFAQLAADHFLALIENAQLNTMPIKIVSHQAALGSHTFLLVDHTSNDLTDLSHCLIVDPWAVAMGHRDRDGVYTEDNYPFPAMTGNLVCCYDNQAPVMTDKKTNKAASTSFDQEIQSAVANRGFFSNRPANQRQEGLSDSQITTVNFLTELSTMTGQATKKSLMLALIDGVKDKSLSSKKALILATVASQARFIEKDGNHYKWKKPTMVDQATLPAFNNKSMLVFWENFINSKAIEPMDSNLKTIDASRLDKIIGFLNTHNEVLEFNQSANIRPRI